MQAGVPGDWPHTRTPPPPASLQVQPGSCLVVKAQLMHVPQPPAAGSEPMFEPYTLLTAAEAAGGNVLTLIPGALQPLPPRYAAAAAAAAGALSCSLALHLPGVDSGEP
jgi:hypothetical protein